MTEETLFTFRQGRYWYSARLVTYPHGGMDLVIQTGPKHGQALADAKVLLRKRGLMVVKGVVENVIGPSGAYYTVKEIL